MNVGEEVEVMCIVNYTFGEYELINLIWKVKSVFFFFLIWKDDTIYYNILKLSFKH